MADISLRSYQQILGPMIAKLLAETNLTDVSVGSVFLTALEAAASSDFTQEGKLLQLINLRNIDKVHGVDLENLASEMGVTPPRLGAESARVNITVSETAFTKIATIIFAGAISPAAGDTAIKVVDASGFTPTGTVYIGRGTPTSESIAYVTATNFGAYWLLNLSSPLTKDHLVGEEVVLAQGGDRPITAGTIVRVPAAAGVAAIQFETLNDAVLADGEDSIAGISAAASSPGSLGNVGIHKIVEFASLPWSTAAVTNDSPATGGRDVETDAELRQRIKDHVHNLAKGTERAIISTVIGVNDPVEQKRVVSAFLREPTVTGQLGILFIDDGTGFAPSFAGVGEEVIVTSAAGTEQFLQLQQFPLVKAQAVSVGTEPFNLIGNEEFLFEVDGQSEQRSVPGDGYRTPGVVLAQEIAEAINKTFTTVEARAKDGRLFVTPVVDDPDYLRVGAASINDANVQVRFPTTKQFTIRLYKNDVLLEKNGFAAIIQSFPNSQWPPFSSSETLQLEIDGILSPVITFTDSDFATLTSSNTILGASAADWAIVVNAKFIGVTATAQDDGTFIIESNRGFNSQAMVAVVGGTLSGTLISATASSSGSSAEFKLNRLLGQIELIDRLDSGDELKAGTVFTAGFALTPAQTAFNFSATLGSPAQMVIITEASAELIVVNQLASLLTFSAPSSGVQRVAGAVGQFSNVKIDDWCFFYNLPEAGLYQVKAVATNGSSVDLFDPDPKTGSDTPDGSNKRISFFRTAGMPQVITLPVSPGVSGDSLAASVNSQLSGGIAEVLDSGVVRFRTLRLDGSGALAIPVLAGTASNLNFAEGTYESNDPHIASIESGDLAGIPSGRLTVSVSDLVAPFDDLQVNGTPFTVENHNRPVLNYLGASSRLIHEPKIKLSASELTLRDEPPLQTVGLGPDLKATTTAACEFGESDNMVFIIDDDAAKKTFDIPMYVDATVSGPSVPSTTQFDGEDSVGDLLGSSTRWQGMRFEDYRVWFKARADLPFSASNSQIRITAAQFGLNGKNIRFGIFYPTVPATDAVASFVIDALNSQILISLFLGSDAERAIGVASGQTISVTVTGPFSGLYNYQIGFDDAVDLSSVLVGDIVSLNDPAFNTANLGQLKIISSNNTIGSKNVVAQRAEAGVNESITAASIQAVRIYPLLAASDNANNLISVVNNTAGVKDLVVASNSPGSSGAGVITTSTDFELHNGSMYVVLQNGQSFIYSSVNASPALTLKEPMDLVPEIGEPFRLVPMTPENITDHFNRKQISGLSIAADISLVNRARHVQVSTKVPGGIGQVYAVGGKASGNNVLNVRNSGQTLSSSVGQVELDRAALDLLMPGQTIKFTQTGLSKKNFVGATPISSTTVQIQVVSPGVGKILFGVPFASIYSYTHTGTVTWVVRQLSRGRLRFEILSGTASIPGGLMAEDWVLVGNGSSYAGTTPPQLFASANQGFFQVRETDNSTYFDIDNTGSEQFIDATTAPFVFFPYHSARVGDKLTIGAASPLVVANRGTFAITAIDSTTALEFTNVDVVAEGPFTLGVNGTDSIRILDQGYSTYRKVLCQAPNPIDPSNRSIIVVQPGYDISLLNEGQSTKMTLPNRLGFGVDPVPGVSGYQYWTGLKQRVQRTLDGFEADPNTFPGVRAAGVGIEAREPQIQRVSLNIKIKTKEGVQLAAISDTIKSGIVGFINSLGLGQDVVLSEIVTIAQEIAGVDSVVLVDPKLDEERITITDKAIARTSPTEVVLS